MKRIFYFLVAFSLASLFAVAPSAPASAAGPSWWNASYSDRLAINVHANDAITSGYSLDVIVNHARMVSQGMSLVSGDDVRIAYYNGTSWTELDRVLAYGSTWNSSTTDLVFKTQGAVTTNTDDTGYYLYYGNGAAVSPLANANNVYALWDDFSGTTLDASKWTTQSPAGVTVAPTGGQLIISGTTDSTYTGTEIGIKTVSVFGLGYQFDSSFSIVGQPANAYSWKGAYGAGSSNLMTKGLGGSVFNEDAAYYASGSFRKIGESYLDTRTFSDQRISESLSPTGVARHSENSILTATRTGAAAGSNVFGYGAEMTVATFDVRFDDIDVRKSVTNEPKVSIEGANDIAFVTTVAPVFSFTVAAHNPAVACNGVLQTAGASTFGTSLAFGRVNAGSPSVAIQDLTVTTNGQVGSTAFVKSSALLTSGANTVADITPTNASPSAFGSGAGFGYSSSGDGRWSSTNWSGLKRTSDPLLSNTGPSTLTACVAYKVQVAANTPASSYSTTITYNALPQF